MCEFKPGDEVVCVWLTSSIEATGFVSVGSTYVIREVDLFRNAQGDPVPSKTTGNMIGVRLVGVYPVIRGIEAKFDATYFRKVQRRDISQWLETATDFEEPKRKKANA